MKQNWAIEIYFKKHQNFLNLKDDYVVKVNIKKKSQYLSPFR